jgi:two-component system response regulator WspF
MQHREPSIEAKPAGVLLINDSPVARAVIGAVVGSCADFKLIGQSPSGLDGVEAAARLRPDLVLLDMHMPDINGVEVTRRILTQRPTKILICTATIRRNTTYLFDALKLGALDYTKTPVIGAKPGARVGRDELLRAGATLIGKMRTVLGLKPPDKADLVPATPAERPERTWSQRDASGRREPGSSPAIGGGSGASDTGDSRVLRIIGIGCSTGGPSALSTLLGALPRNLAAPVMVSQHIDEEFTAGLADWLGRGTGQQVQVARNGEAPVAGRVYLARGGRNSLVLKPTWRLGYEPCGDAIYYPNIDHMLASLAAVAGGNACGVVLTGLGDDGAVGMAELKGRGAKLLVQDPATAVVDGMPGAVLRRGILTQGHGLTDLARMIEIWAGRLP